MENYRNLPKGICYLRNRQRFMGRFQHNKQSYTFYDKNLDNLIEKMNKAKYELSLGLDIKQNLILLMNGMTYGSSTKKMK